MKTRSSDAERLTALKARRDQLQARIASLNAREQTKKRSNRNRALALLGVLLEANLKNDQSLDVEPLVAAASNLLRPVDASFLSDWLRGEFGKKGPTA